MAKLQSRRTFLAALLVVAVVVLMPPSPAGASTRPTAAFRFVTNSVTAGTSATITYATRNLPRRATVVLQRQFGTRHVWRRVRYLRRSGTASVPAVPMGLYYYRIHVTKHRRVVANSRARRLFSYGQINLSNMCNDDTVSTYGCNFDATVQVGSTLFPYLFYDGFASTAPGYDEILSTATSSCRSISVQWGLDNDTAGPGDAATLQIVRSDADPQSGTANYGSIGTLDAQLDGGAWAIDVSVAPSPSGNFNAVAVNDAALSCYTSSGLP